MAVAQSINNAWSYVVGNCTWFVAQTLSWVPSGLGNAKDWLANAQRKGLPISKTPHVGDVVVYGFNPQAGYPSPYGHVAVVQSVETPQRFTVSEMNVRGLGVQDTRKSTLSGVLGFIEPPKPMRSTGAAAGNIAGSLGAAAGNLPHVPNPLDLPGAVAGGFTNLTHSVDAATTALNPTNWLMTIWNDHLKGNIARALLVLVGIWLIIIGITIMFRDEVQQELTGGDKQTTPIAAPTRAPAAGEAAEAAPVAAV